MPVFQRVRASLRRYAKRTAKLPGQAGQHSPLTADLYRPWLAILRRRILTKIAFVGVTGSCGKTTTTQLIGAVLSSAGECRIDSGGPHNAARDMLSLKASSKYCVHEVHGSAPGRIKEHVRILRPRIGVVTNVGQDHYKNYRTLEATALEKGRLVEWLPRDGVAILNADDPHVLAMAGRTAARVMTYGLSPDTDLRATDISGAWPDRLSLTVVHGNERLRLHTRFLGDYWTTSVLAAIACGIACGLDLKSCADAIAVCEPAFGRCSVHSVPNDSHYVLDSKKAALWTVANSFALMRSAAAARKTMIFGTISDYPGSGSRTYRKVARQALDVVDRVVFVGPQASHVDRLRQGDIRDRLFAFETSYQASAHLASSAVAGELIFVKASLTDHLERLMLDRIGEVVCWRERCGKLSACPECKRYRRPHPAPFSLARVADSIAEVAEAPGGA
jgi:UDP-N-acetylmuramoyl-tripeptide--D-alanyl-D-alanine ligase